MAMAFVRPDGSIGAAPGHGVAFVGMGKVANVALGQSGLGWFVDLRSTHQWRNIAEINTTQFAVEVVS
jgi:hypothetical protein